MPLSGLPITVMFAIMKTRYVTVSLCCGGPEIHVCRSGLFAPSSLYFIVTGADRGFLPPSFFSLNFTCTEQAFLPPSRTLNKQLRPAIDFDGRPFLHWQKSLFCYNLNFRIVCKQLLDVFELFTQIGDYLLEGGVSVNDEILAVFVIEVVLDIQSLHLAHALKFE